MVILFASARAASVVCDTAHASAVVADARVDPSRAPVTHPWLVPGLALDSGPPEVVRAVQELCAGGAEVAVERAEVWDQAPFAAYTLILSRVGEDGCRLVRRRVPLTVGVSDEGPRYTVRGSLPEDWTPIGDCAEPAVWREERVLAGGEGPVRLVATLDWRGEAVVGSGVVVRRATAVGWSEQALLQPAPERAVGLGDQGAELHLAGGDLVVATRDRRVGPEGCEPVGDQRVWHLQGEAWEVETGRAAAARLARAGAWREAAQDGWFLLVGQDDEEDRDLVGPRLKRLQRRTQEDLQVWTSSMFPGLHPGYAFIAPAPFSTRAEAEAAAADFPPSRQVYVKQGWSALPACPEP